jgi:hypothetical protein
MRVPTLSLVIAMALAPSVSLAGGVRSGADDSAKSDPGVGLNFLGCRVKLFDDFYTYANGRWVARNPIPPEYPALGTPYPPAYNANKN